MQRNGGRVYWRLPSKQAGQKSPHVQHRENGQIPCLGGFPNSTENNERVEVAQGGAQKEIPLKWRFLGSMVKPKVEKKHAYIFSPASNPKRRRRQSVVFPKTKVLGLRWRVATSEAGCEELVSMLLRRGRMATRESGSPSGVEAPFPWLAPPKGPNFRRFWTSTFWATILAIESSDSPSSWTLHSLGRPF